MRLQLQSLAECTTNCLPGSGFRRLAYNVVRVAIPLRLTTQIFIYSIKFYTKSRWDKITVQQNKFMACSSSPVRKVGKKTQSTAEVSVAVRAGGDATNTQPDVISAFMLSSHVMLKTYGKSESLWAHGTLVVKDTACYGSSVLGNLIKR